jgi:SAM-dependent methyltransferase
MKHLEGIFGDLMATGASNDLKRFWEDVATRMSGKKYLAVLDISGPLVWNWCMDRVQSKVLYGQIPAEIGNSLAIDAGCGVGRWAIRLAERGATVVAFDISRGMVSEAMKRAGKKSLRKNIDFIVASVTNIPLRNTVGDFSVCITVVQHLAEISRVVAAIEELKRISKKVYLLELTTDSERPVKKPHSTIIQLPTSQWLSLLGAGSTSPATYVGVDLGVFVRIVDKIRYRINEKFKKSTSSVKASSVGEDELLTKGILEVINRPDALVMSYHVAQNLAALLSFPFDLKLRNRFKEHTFHKLFIVEKGDEDHALD